MTRSETADNDIEKDRLIDGKVKKVRKTVSVILTIVMLLSLLGLTACGNQGEDISGSYKLIEMEANGSDYSTLLKSAEEDVIMTIEGSHATIAMGERSIEWTVDTKNSLMKNASGSETPYRFEGDLLIVEGENAAIGKMVFEKQ